MVGDGLPARCRKLTDAEVPYQTVTALQPVGLRLVAMPCCGDGTEYIVRTTSCDSPCVYMGSVDHLPQSSKRYWRNSYEDLYIAELIEKYQCTPSFTCCGDSQYEGEADGDIDGGIDGGIEDSSDDGQNGDDDPRSDGERVAVAAPDEAVSAFTGLNLEDRSTLLAYLPTYLHRPTCFRHCYLLTSLLTYLLTYLRHYLLTDLLMPYPLSG